MAATTELKLNGKAPLARTLDLRVSVQGYLFAMLYVGVPKAPKMLAYASVKLSDCHLFLGKHDNSALWLDHAAFDVSETEAQQIRATYEPLGLHIEKESESLGIKLQSSADAAVHP